MADSGEIKYRGVRKRPSGKYGVEIRVFGKSHSKQKWIGSFNTAEEAARAYDKAAYDTRGQGAILNFAEEYNLPITSSHFYRPDEVFVIECCDDQVKVLENLLDITTNQNGRR